MEKSNYLFAAVTRRNNTIMLNPPSSANPAIIPLQNNQPINLLMAPIYSNNSLCCVMRDRTKRYAIVHSHMLCKRVLYGVGDWKILRRSEHQDLGRLVQRFSPLPQPLNII
jgi:hypothetical protein